MENSTAKASRLNIRCDVRTRALLDKAATYAHVSLSEFVLSQALATAEKIIQAHENITLQPDDFKTFLDALETPVEANAALQKAFKQHKEHVLK